MKLMVKLMSSNSYLILVNTTLCSSFSPDLAVHDPLALILSKDSNEGEVRKEDEGRHKVKRC